MNWRAIKALIVKDLRVVVQSKAVMIPAIIVPAIFIVVIPILFSFFLSNPELMGETNSDLEPFLANMPASISADLAPFTELNQQFFYIMMVYQFATLFLIVPLMLANVIASDSFVGEKERKTLEALIYTPTTDLEIYVAKLLTAWIPALVITFISGIIYMIVVNLSGYSVMGQMILPTTLWVVLLLWVAPAAAGLGLSATVLVSSRVNTFQEAQQVGGVIVLPIVGLMVGQFSGLIYLSPTVLLIGGAILWLIDGALLWYGASTFQRGELIAKL
jgi:ABC-2 type transport system permease protein